MPFFEIQHWTRSLVRYTTMCLIGFGAGIFVSSNYLGKELPDYKNVLNSELAVMYKVEQSNLVPYIVQTRGIKQKFDTASLIEFNPEQNLNPINLESIVKNYEVKK